MKLVYLAVFDRKRDVGVYHKITDQLKGFEFYGIEARLVHVSQMASRIPIMEKEFSIVSYSWGNIILQDNVDALYIRYPKSSPGFLKFLRGFKKGRPDRKVIIEIPTYPYDGELIVEDFLPDMLDKMTRSLLKRYVDRIVTYSKDRRIFGIHTLRSINGICVDEISPRKIKGPADEINMIAVASMKFWHGYERIIKGMANYYQTGGKRILNLHLVGEGPDIPLYKQLVGSSDLNRRVKFYGVKEGKKLDEIYNICDIGIVSLGDARKNVKISSALKTREYAAKGLPMINDIRIDIFPEERYSFIHRVPTNETQINMPAVIDWYDDLNGIYGEKRQEVADNIRVLACQKCDIKVAMRNICRYLLHSKKGTAYEKRNNH